MDNIKKEPIKIEVVNIEDGVYYITITTNTLSCPFYFPDAEFALKFIRKVFEKYGLRFEEFKTNEWIYVTSDRQIVLEDLETIVYELADFISTALETFGELLKERNEF